MKRISLFVSMSLLLTGLAALPAGVAQPAKRAEAPSGSLPVKVREWKGDLDGMVERRLIRALVVNSKTFYFLEEGRQYGASYEGLKAFEKELNRKIRGKKRKIHVVFIPVSRDKLIPALLDGQGDIAAANLTITPERLKQVDFSVPIYSNVSEIVVTGPSSPKIASVEDLSGKEVFVRKSSSYHEHLEQLNARFRKERKPLVKLRPAPEILEDEDLLEMLNAGLVNLLVVDSHKAQFWEQVFKSITLHPKAAVHTGGRIAWMFRKNSPRLKKAVDAFVKTHRKGTSFGNQIIQRYMKSTRFVKNATSEAELRKYRKMVALFKKYGSRYDIDYLLVMAQGYQESQLDQSVRSRSGAIGVMQVMPATGKELGVGNIRKLEPNIHAGVKYIRFMIDRYYAKEPMDQLNKMLFAFASYNAGPSRIEGLRKEAARRGLNPNVWFNNV
ncbi:MAG: lytic transglycosylase F, partial [Thermodesulfobacteriota bacterium]|nr:lytic transglycosylase F [Thermodesulfobacteriota bacterium]